jgi:uncharacterized membrane protein AbrB (regulator of aidB expression)
LAEGADARVVAFMQYSRVLLVALGAALVARVWAGNEGAHSPGTHWLIPVHWGHLAAVLLLAALGQQAARLLRLPGWALLGPMLLLSVLHASGWIAIELARRATGPSRIQQVSAGMMRPKSALQLLE